MYILKSETKEWRFENVSELLDFMSFCVNNSSRNMLCSPQMIPGERIPLNGLPGGVGLDDWL